MKEISLTQGEIAYVDDRLHTALIDRGPWAACHKKTNWYATRIETVAGRKRAVYMHQVVWRLAGCTLAPDQQIDHRDQNGLNNQIANLRAATIPQQRRNRRKTADRTSRFKGVCWSTQKQKWRATIGGGKNQKHLGFRTDERAAARLYDQAAQRLYGGCASPNERKAES